MHWTRTAATTLVTGYIVTLRNETGMTTREVKFGINDYLGARTSFNDKRWTLLLYHGTNCVMSCVNRYSTEASARAAARAWINSKLQGLRVQYRQAEGNVIADCLSRGYQVESTSP